MKYLSKEPMVFGPTKQYSDNYPNINWKDDKVDMEIELDDDLLEFVKKEAEKRNKTIEETVGELLEEGLKILEEKEKENK